MVGQFKGNLWHVQLHKIFPVRWEQNYGTNQWLAVAVGFTRAWVSVCQNTARWLLHCQMGSAQGLQCSRPMLLSTQSKYSQAMRSQKAGGHICLVGVL